MSILSYLGTVIENKTSYPFGSLNWIYIPLKKILGGVPGTDLAKRRGTIFLLKYLRRTGGSEGNEVSVLDIYDEPNSSK